MEAWAIKARLQVLIYRSVLVTVPELWDLWEPPMPAAWAAAFVKEKALGWLRTSTDDNHTAPVIYVPLVEVGASSTTE